MVYVKGHTSNKGKNNPNFGKKHSPETIEKMREIKLKNPVRYWKGKQRSKQTKEKIRASKLGQPSPKKGIKLSKEIIDKMKESQKGKSFGKNNPNWKGGISKIDKLCRGIQEYKNWRASVFFRDDYTCQECGKKKCYITAHHKKSFSKILKENNIESVKEAIECDELWDINNGKTLCEDCHSLTDNYKGRAKLSKIKICQAK